MGDENGGDPGMALRLKLAAMMFFQYAVWGAWTPILGATLSDRLNATGTQVGWVYGVLWLACILTPFIGGQLVDRLMPSQLFLALAGMVCAVSAWMMSQQEHIGGLIVWMWVWSVAFAPTLGIANSIAFYHLGREAHGGLSDSRRVDYAPLSRAVTTAWFVVAAALVGYVIYKGFLSAEWTTGEKQITALVGAVVVLSAVFPLILQDLRRRGTGGHDTERSFSVVRTAGTIGWIVASLLLTAYLLSRPPVEKGHWVPYEEMQLAAIFGVLLVAVALLLPNTPPSRQSKDPWAFTKAFALFRTVPGFTAFMLISLVVSTEFQFYYVLSAPFMEAPRAQGGLGIDHDLVSLYKSIAQYAEILCLGVFTPLSLRYLGLRKTLVIGALAWPLRYFIFALGQPVWLVLASMSFHGIGFAFVFVTSYIYIDRVAPRDIRASAQSLLTLVTLGIGNWLGTLFCGWLKDHYTTFVPDPNHPAQMIPGAVNWTLVFVIPAILCLACAAAYWLTFREPAEVSGDEGVGQAELETVQASA